jgi:hypothetical protein
MTRDNRMYFSLLLAMISIRAETGMTTTADAADLRRLSTLLIGVTEAQLKKLSKEAQ